MRRGRVVVVVVVALVLLAAAGVAWYVGDYNHADETARAALEPADDGVTVVPLDDGSIAFEPMDARVGLVFYPGAKVEPEAYAPLLRSCAERGVLCVAVRPPLNLALLDVGAADRIMAKYPNVSDWFAMGHSMGGVAAADYVAGHEDNMDALVLLAAYPNNSLKDFAGEVCTFVGTEDGVVNRQKLDEADEKLPAGAELRIIEGGNHANYGDYGAQKNDGQAAISAREQQKVVAEEVATLAQAA